MILTRGKWRGAYYLWGVTPPAQHRKPRGDEGYYSSRLGYGSRLHDTSVTLCQQLAMEIQM